VRVLGPVILLLVLLPVAQAALTPAEVKPYVGTMTRDPLLGPHPVCDVNGMNVGGACFPINGSFPVIRVKDDHSIGSQQIIVYSFLGTVGLPADATTFCARNNEPFAFSPAHAFDRIVIGVGPAASNQGVCAAGPGTTGTITVQWWR
jgi:hypothetical protein